MKSFFVNRLLPLSGVDFTSLMKKECHSSKAEECYDEGVLDPYHYILESML